MVSIQKAVLDRLIEKIDTVTPMAKHQKEELADLEMRLNNEMKMRENHLAVLIDNLSQSDPPRKLTTLSIKMDPVNHR